MTECAHCGKPLRARSGPGRPRSYCGDTCRYEAKAERESLWRTIGQAAVAVVEQRSKKGIRA